MTTIFNRIAEPGSLPDLELRALRRDIERGRAEHRVTADRNECDLETWLLNYNRCLEIVANIQANGAIDLARIASLQLNANFLYAAKAQSLVAEVFDNPCDWDYHRIISSAVTVGAFSEIALGIKKAQLDSRAITVTKLIPIALKASETLAELGISDAQVALCLDVAGEVMRSRRMLWMGSGPDIYVVPASSGTPAVSIEYRVPISAVDASSMSWELTEKIVDRDLYVPGLSVGFLGVLEPVGQ